MPLCLYASVPLCLCLFECGLPNRGIKNIMEPVPRSNVQVEEEVIKRALNDLGLPDGHGREVMCVVEGDDMACDMLRVIAPEVLLQQHYQIAEKKPSVPKLRFTVDTLRVVLTSERSQEMGKRIQRYAVAHIAAAFLDTDGTRRVFTGRGTFDDSFASYMLDSVGSNNPYIIDSVSLDRYKAKVKPVVFGVAMTVLAWMLYSYRG